MPWVEEAQVGQISFATTPPSGLLHLSRQKVLAAKKRMLLGVMVRGTWKAQTWGAPPCLIAGCGVGANDKGLGV